MALIKILKNNSGEEKQILNRMVPIAGSFTIPTNQWLKLAADTFIAEGIASGALVANDGINDLSIAEGLKLIQRFQFDSSEKITFDNTGNSFSATNVQAAIEEAKNASISTSRFTIVTSFNGDISNNQWLGYNEVLPGNRVPIRIAVKCNLREISLSYRQNNLLEIPLENEQIDGQLKIFKNGLSDPTHVVNTTTIINEAGGKIITGLNIPLNSGDYIVGKWIDTGNKPNDMAVVYYFEVIQ